MRRSIHIFKETEGLKPLANPKPGVWDTKDQLVVPDQLVHVPSFQPSICLSLLEK